METVVYISILINYCIFIFFGYLFAKRFDKPFNTTKWVLIVSATIIAGWIRIGRLVDIFNFVIQFNWSLQGFGIGFILGILKKKFTNKIALN